MRSEAEGWWEQAGEDLQSARTNLAAERYYVCAFLCQQALEKAFKALWIERFRELPPKTHDLLGLAERLSVPADFSTALRNINPAYATARYPDAANGLPARAFNEEIARRDLEGAEKVISWCEKELGAS